MSDNQLPIQIVILPPKQGEVERSLTSIQKQVESQGRKIGETVSKSVANATLGATKGPRMDKWIRENLIKPWEQATPAARKAKDKFYNELFKVDSIVSSMGTKKVIENALVKPWEQATPAARKAMQKHYNDVFGAIPIAEIRANARKAADEVKRANQEAYAKSPSGIYEAAGIKGAAQRTAEANAVRAAQKQLNEELKAGAINLGQYNVIMGDTEKKLNLIESGNVRARGALHKFTAQLASLTFELTGAIYGIGIMATTLASPMLFGIGFLRKLEDSKMGMAGILMSMGEVNGEALTFEQAMSASNSQMNIMAKESINLAGKLEEFAATYRSILAPGLAAGMNLDEIRKIAIAGTVAVKTIGLDARQIVQETRDLVAGGIQAASSTLATSLGITDADIKRARLSSEGLFKFLEKRLEGFVEAAKKRSETLSGRMEQVGEIITQGLGKASEGAFQTVKKLFDEMANAIAVIDEQGQFVSFRPEFIDTLKTYINLLDMIIGALAKVVKLMIEFKEVIFVLIGAKIGIALWGGMTKAAQTYIAVLGSIATAQKAAAASAILSGQAYGSLARGIVSTGGLNSAVDALISAGTKVAFRAGVVGAVLFGAYQLADYLVFFDTVQNRIDKLKEGMVAFTELQLQVQKNQAKSEANRLRGGGMFNIFTYSSKEQAIAEQVRIMAEIDSELRKRGKEEETKKFGDEIGRMDASLNKAKDALKNMNSEFYKGTQEIGKTVQSMSAYNELLKDIDLLRGKSSTDPKVQQRLKDYEKEAELLKRSFEDEIKHARMKSAVDRASTKEEKERLEFELKKFEDLRKPRGEEFELLARKAELAQDALPWQRELIDLQLRENRGVIDSINARKLQLDKMSEYSDALRDLAKLEQDAYEKQRANAENIRKARGDVTYTEGTLTRLQDLDMTSQYDFTLPRVEGLSRSTSELAREDVLQNSIKYEEQRIALIEDYANKMVKNATEEKLSLETRQALQDQYGESLGNQLAVLESQKNEMEEIVAKQYDWSTGAADAFKQYNDAVLNSAQHARDVWGAAFKGMEDGLVNFVKTGKFSFRDFAAVIIDQLIRIQAQQMTMTMFGGMFGGFFGGFGGTPYTAASGGYGGIPMTGMDYAKGAAFGKGGIQNFANGSAFSNGIVSTPTLFNFAKGTGRMGEAGPEAIMPLTRTTSGDLGVQAIGGAGNATVNQISVTVNIDSNGTAKTEASSSADSNVIGKLVAQAVQTELLKQQRPGGMLNR